MSRRGVMVHSTQVAIIGAGPSGLLLSQLLSRAGIDSIVLERESREHVQGRIRAGLLEWTTVELLQEAGVGARMMREGLIDEGFDVAFANGRHRIDLKALTGKNMLVYGQNELQRDLVEARSEPGAVLWQVRDASLHDFDTRAPQVSFAHAGSRHELRCDFVAGCDGYHGISRASVPAEKVVQYQRVYPFGWLGMLADVRVLSQALIEFYGNRSAALLEEYSARALSRVWKATRFSWWFTLLMHRFSADPFARRLQLAELEYLASSAAASRSLAENYVGLSFD